MGVASAIERESGYWHTANSFVTGREGGFFLESTVPSPELKNHWWNI